MPLYTKRKLILVLLFAQDLPLLLLEYLPLPERKDMVQEIRM